MEIFTFLELLTIAAFIKHKEFELHYAFAAFIGINILEFCSNALVLYIKSNHLV